jgi:hypothetical protein
MEDLLKKLASIIFCLAIIHKGVIWYKKPRQFQIYNKIDSNDEEGDNKISLEKRAPRRPKKVKRSWGKSECQLNKEG